MSVVFAEQEFQPVSSITFFFYSFFLIEFFLHLAVRIPGLGVIRPTFLLVLIVIALLFSQRQILSKRGINETSKAIKLLLLYLILTLPFVTYPGSVIKNNIPYFVKAVVFFYFTASVVDTPRRLKMFLFIFVGCQLFRVLEPLYLHITTGYWGDATYLGEGEFANRLAGAPSDVINPNELGFIIATIVPFLHFLLLPKGGVKKIIYMALMAAILYALILTMSRGAMLALLVVGFIVFKESKNKITLLAMAMIVAVVGWSIMTPVQKDRYLSLISSDAEASATVDGRFRGMGREFELGMRRPVLGHGIGTTNEAKYHFTGKSQASHNLYAELLIEIGVIGMFFFLRFLFSIYRTISQLKKVIPKDHLESAQMLKVVLSLFFMYLVYSTNYWGLSQNYWYLLGGLSVALIQIIERNKGKDLYEDVNTK